MSTFPTRKLAVAAILLFWLATLVWLVFFEAFPGLLERSVGGYRAILSQGVMVMDQWMKITFQGKPIGYSHTSVGANDDGSDREYLVNNQTVLDLDVMGVQRRVSLVSHSVIDVTYRLQTFSFLLSSTGYAIEVRGQRKHGDTYAVTVRGSSSTQRTEITIPADAVLYSPMTEMMLKSLAPGRQVTLRIFNPVTLSAQSIVIRALRRESIVNRSRSVEATVLSALVDGMETVSWIGPDGAVLRQETAFGWTMESCDAKEALNAGSGRGRLNADMLTSLAVPVTGPVARLPSAQTATLRLTGAPLDAVDLASQRQSVLSVSGTVAELRVRADTLVSSNSPPGPPATNLAPWLASTLFVQADDSRLIEKAREITAGTAGPPEAALAIYRWVHDNVTKSPTVSLPSALDVLLHPEGDCNEHTYLFVGLARAAGIPAKIRVGLTLHNGLFYYHAWPSVYLGRWVDMDPTLGQPAVGADHISLFEGELPEQMRLMGLLGRLKIELVSVDEL